MTKRNPLAGFVLAGIELFGEVLAASPQGRGSPRLTVKLYRPAAQRGETVHVRQGYATLYL